MFLLLAPLLWSSTPSPCSGEFELNAATGECVLSVAYNPASGGYDADEPTASHRDCAPGAFRCPAGACVATAAEYAACCTGRSAEHFIAAAAASSMPPPAPEKHSENQRCNLTGTWHCAGVDGQVSMDGALAGFSVTALHAPPGFLWSVGHGTTDGDGGVTLTYPTPQETYYRGGTVGGGCASIAFNDSTAWSCVYDDASHGTNSGSCPAPAPAPPAGPIRDVHIVCHTHDDTGYTSTVDEYYASNVRSILTTVVAELRKDPARKFTYVVVARFLRDD